MTLADHSVVDAPAPTHGRDQYFKQVYHQLRRAARHALASYSNQTINTTALVHEAWLKLERADATTSDHAHYLKTAALAMRQLLVDHARYRRAEKRDRGLEMPLFEEAIAHDCGRDAGDVLALELALIRLEQLDPPAAQIVLLRFYGGASLEEAADICNTSRRTAARLWTRARAFLRTQLTP